MPRGYSRERRPLTARSVARLPVPARGQVDYFDPALPGFGVRVSYGGRRSYFVMYRFRDGRKRRYTIGPAVSIRLADARERARELQGQAWLGQDPAGDRIAARRAMTFGELAAEYMERYAKPEKRTWRHDEQRLKRDLLPAFGGVKAEQVGSDDVEELLDAIVRRGAPIAANRTLEVVRGIYNWAARRRRPRLKLANPAAGLAKPAAERKRSLALTADQLAALWTALDEEPAVAAAVIRGMILTNQRHNELVHMRWSDLDRRAWWNLPPELTKTARPYRVPILPMMGEVIEAAGTARRDPVWVFARAAGGAPLTYKVYHGACRRAAQRARLDGFRPHDIRRTVTSHLASMGFSHEDRAKILHHAQQMRQTADYTEYAFDDDKRRILAAWERQLRRYLGLAPAPQKIVELRG